MENISSEQELKDLLEEGKISEEEYEELLGALNQQEQRLHQDAEGAKGDTAQMQSKGSFSFENVPWQIWGITALLVLEGIGNLFMIPKYPVAIIWLLAKVVFVIGLLRGWKWVFVLFQVIAGIHVLYFGMAGGFLASVLNLILMILAFTTLRYFFPIKAAY
jgi:hypothetical protein